MAWLLRRSRRAAALGDVLKETAPVLGSPTVCLLFQPRDCVVARLDADGSLESSEGQKLAPGGSFEARAFGPNAELRWVHRIDETGEAVALAEEGAGDLSMLAAGWTPTERIGPVEPKPVRYLLWGSARVDDRPAGWTRLASARTRDLRVPLDYPGDARHVYLQGREYLGRMTTLRPGARDDGNVVVVEELLRLLAAEETPR